LKGSAIVDRLVYLGGSSSVLPWRERLRVIPQCCFWMSHFRQSIK
jgi:hypothetical protein